MLSRSLPHSSLLRGRNQHETTMHRVPPAAHLGVACEGLCVGSEAARRGPDVVIPKDDVVSQALLQAHRSTGPHARRYAAVTCLPGVSELRGHSVRFARSAESKGCTLGNRHR